MWLSTAAIAFVLSAVAHASPQDAPAAAQDVVIRRGKLEPLRGEITQIDEAGVSMRGISTTNTVTVVAWHRIRDVDSAKFDTEWKKFERVAEELWRAVSRVQRGDPLLAEAQLEQLFARFQDQTHETALVVAEGLLRCRLARGANDQAVLPWLEVARMRHAGALTHAYDELEPVLDETTLLCPMLPPAWPKQARLQRALDELDAFNAGDDAVVSALALLYRNFMKLELGQTVKASEVELPQHSGVAMLNDLFVLRSTERDLPPAEIERAKRLAANWPSWARAWLHYQLGTALLRKSDRPSQDLGLVQLAHVPARFRFEQPFLAGLAIAEMAEQLEARGDADHAATMRRLVDERYPGHPAAELTFRDRTTERANRP